MIQPRFNLFSFCVLWSLLIISFNFLFAKPALADATCTKPDDAHIAPYLGTWEGLLGEQRIVLHLEPHREDIQRVQGYYTQEENPSHHILFVGEQIKGFFEGEESSNGSDISGLWELSFPAQAPTSSECYLTLRGEWVDHNFENPRSIQLERNRLSW